MARSLKFSVNSEEMNIEIEKLDRNKVYGWVEKKYIDRDGNDCFFGSISQDGTSIFGKEAFESGYLSSANEWLERSDLDVLDAEGNKVEQKEASFKQTIPLQKQVSVDDFLDYVVKSVYQLDAPQSLIDLVKTSDQLFCFPFNYTASYTPDNAFLIENENTLFMLIGQHCGFQFLEMQEISPILEDDDEDDGDDIDFSMF